MPQSFTLSGAFDLPSNPAKHETHMGQGMVVTAQSTCLGRARGVCADIELGMDIGAFPTAHAVMITRVREADADKIPLSITVRFDP